MTSYRYELQLPAVHEFLINTLGTNISFDPWISGFYLFNAEKYRRFITEVEKNAGTEDRRKKLGRYVRQHPLFIVFETDDDALQFIIAAVDEARFRLSTVPELGVL